VRKEETVVALIVQQVGLPRTVVPNVPCAVPVHLVMLPRKGVKIAPSASGKMKVGKPNAKTKKKEK
jgi:hypothetical protein